MLVGEGSVEMKWQEKTQFQILGMFSAKQSSEANIFGSKVVDICEAWAHLGSSF